MLFVMTLLYLALAYMVGIAVGQLAWDIGWLGYTWPTWFWCLPLAILPCVPLLNHLSWLQPKHQPLRWPVHAGFTPPRMAPSPAFWVALALCILIGALRYASYPLEHCWTASDLAYYNLPAERAFDKAAPLIAITGYVNSYPLVADTKQRMEVVAQQIEFDGIAHPVQGTLRLSTSIYQRYHYGQPMRLVGRLVTPPEFEDFSYLDYLARKGIYSLLYSAHIETLPGSNGGHPLLQMLYTIRARGERLVNRLLPEPYAALANGMLLGIESGIPDALYDQFNLTGSSHVIVISGSNVALIAGVIMGVAQRLLGRRRVLWPTLTGIAGYALLVGGDAAVLRAALMGGLYVIATVLNRRSTALVSLTFACWVMTLLNPLTLWDVGFQLSSAATAGLILFTPGLQARFQQMWNGNRPKPQLVIHDSALGNVLSHSKGILQSFLEAGLITTLAANITTLPLVVYYFERLSIVSLATNLAILPVQPLVMLSGSGGVLLGLLGAEWLAQITLWFTWLGLVWTVLVVQSTANLPGASLSIASYGFGSLVLTYLLLFGLRWRERIWGRVVRFVRVDWRAWWARLIGPGATVGMSACVLLIWMAASALPDGRLHVYFLDIGQGDGILIQTPSGRQVLIDGGASPQQLFSQLGEVMPFWDRSLDLVVMTNPDKDHMDAQAQIPTRLQIHTALETKTSQSNPDADLWRANMTAATVDVRLQAHGGWIDLGDGVALWVLWPPVAPFLANNDEQTVDNENSLIMKLVYGDFSVLLTGDAGLPAESAMLTAAMPLAATVLKVGHHGSKGSTSAAFVQTVDPLIAVIQSGADNSYGHPHQDTLDRLAGRLILRNDQQGRVHVYSDGHQMWLDTANNPPQL